MTKVAKQYEVKWRQAEKDGTDKLITSPDFLLFLTFFLLKQLINSLNRK